MKLSKRLGPKAKRMVLQSAPTQSVSGLIQISGRVETERLRRSLEEHGATIRGWMDQDNLVTIDTEVSRLAELAEVGGVVYLEAGERYSPSQSSGPSPAVDDLSIPPADRFTQ